MNPNHQILLAFCLGILLRTLTNPWILGYFNVDYSIHKNKIYDAIFFGSLVGLIQILLDNSLLNYNEKIFWIILFVSFIFILNYMINQQVYISDDDLLLKLKENYAESIKFTNIQIKNKSMDDKLKEFLLEQNDTKTNAINQINVFLKKNKILYQ